MHREGTPSSRSTASPEGKLSKATAGRLSLYLRRLEALGEEGRSRVSSGILGETLGIGDAQVRKDLASIGNLGHPGVGYEVHPLSQAIRHVLGVDREWKVAVVGVGHLARALLRYHGFLSRGFRIVALFDCDETKIGQQVQALEIHSPAVMGEVVAATGAEVGIVSVPSEAAQEVADSLVQAGVRGLLNFAPCVLRVPANVQVVGVDLTVQLEQLAFLIQLNDDTTNTTSTRPRT
jgi:redox-sensing transcriptional repressor